MDIDESILGDVHRNLLCKALMLSDEDAFWESILKRITSHQDVAEEDVQDIRKPSLWAVVVKVKVIQSSRLIFVITFLLSLVMRSR